MKIKRSVSLVASLCAASLVFGVSLPAKADPKLDASKFLLKSFVNGQYLDGFTPGKPDFGFSLEALLQLSQYPAISGQLGAAKYYLLKDSRIIGGAGKSGYVIDGTSKQLNPAAAAKFAFVSAVVQAGNQDVRNQILSKLARQSTNQLALSHGSTFAYAWVVLALEANHKVAAANRLTKALLKLQQKDGGFAVDSTADSTGSSTDATGIALQALAALKHSGATNSKAVSKAVKLAVGYLAKTRSGNHWMAWGDVDVNGTAYALMGLRAVGRNVSSGIKWLLSQVSASDGGITTPWSNGAGDRFATAQSLLILKNLSYADLIRN